MILLNRGMKILNQRGFKLLFWLKNQLILHPKTANPSKTLATPLPQGPRSQHNTAHHQPREIVVRTGKPISSRWLIARMISHLVAVLVVVLWSYAIAILRVGVCPSWGEVIFWLPLNRIFMTVRLRENQKVVSKSLSPITLGLVVLVIAD